MDHFAGLDVSVKQTSICIVDATGRIVREVKVASEPEALLKVLGNPTYHFKRIGLRVARELNILMAARGRPAMIVSDNGTELTSMVMLRWSQEHPRRVAVHQMIRPSSLDKARGNVGSISASSAHLPPTNSNPKA